LIGTTTGGFFEISPPKGFAVYLVSSPNGFATNRDVCKDTGREVVVDVVGLGSNGFVATTREDGCFTSFESSGPKGFEVDTFGLVVCD
jgi:hypothetical protein